jgi:hypothetical protein
MSLSSSLSFRDPAPCRSWHCRLIASQTHKYSQVRAVSRTLELRGFRFKLTFVKVKPAAFAFYGLFGMPAKGFKVD